MATPPPLPFAQAIADMSTSVVAMLGNVMARIDGVAVQALFANESAFTQHSPIGYESAHPTLTLRTQDVPLPAVGLEVTIGADDYTIYSHEPDGAGLSRLVLEKAT